MPPQVAGALRQAARRLREAGVENAAAEAAWLLAHVLGSSVGQLHLAGERELSAAPAAAFAALVQRRCRREPLQYILGTQEFMGLSLQVTPAVLIPRPETETLVQRLAERLPPGAVVADIGTGSGCIALGLCRVHPTVRVIATDISTAALAVAAENARRAGYAGRVAFRQGDLYEPLAGQAGEPLLDGIAANPPYVAASEHGDLMPEVRDWEPRDALCPGPDPLAIIRRLVAGAPARLRPGGWLALEVGAGQAPAVAALYRWAGLTATAYPDRFGVVRCVIGQHTGAG